MLASILRRSRAYLLPSSSLPPFPSPVAMRPPRLSPTTSLRVPLSRWGMNLAASGYAGFNASSLSPSKSGNNAGSHRDSPRAGRAPRRRGGRRRYDATLDARPPAAGGVSRRDVGERGRGG